MLSLRRHDHRRIWTELGEVWHDSWRGMVRAAASAADNRTPPLPAVEEYQKALAELERTHGRKVFNRLSDADNDQTTAVWDRAVLLGFALARTWPDRLEDLDAWPDRALAYAGLTDQAGTAPADADAIAAWLTDQALVDASPHDAIKKLLDDAAALERLRSTASA